MDLFSHIFLKRKSYKIQYRVMLSKYRGLSSCKQCKGSRLNSATQYIYVNNKNIHHLVNLPIKELLKFIKKININNHDETRQASYHFAQLDYAYNFIKNKFLYVENLSDFIRKDLFNNLKFSINDKENIICYNLK